MSLDQNKFQLVELPAGVTFSHEEQEIIFLIGEELKNTKMHEALTNMGVEDSIYVGNLTNLICYKLGNPVDEDEVYEILEKHCRLIEGTLSSITRQAIDAYHELTALEMERG